MTTIFDTRTGLEYETTNERVFGECTWHAHPIMEKSELDKNPRAPVSIDELVGSRYTAPLFEILSTGPSTPFGTVMIDRIYQLSFILTSLGWVHTRSEEEGILGRITRPALLAAIQSDQTLFDTINKEAASIPLITSDGKGAGKYGPAAFCFTRTLGEMRNIVQSLKMNTSFKSAVFANAVTDEQRKLLNEFFVDTTIARDSVRPRTVDCFNRVMPLPIGHVVSWLPLPLGALDNGRGDIKTIRKERCYAILRPEYDYDIGVGREDINGNDRDPINNWGVHAGRYLCCGLDASSPGCLIDTYTSGNPRPKRYKLGVTPQLFWDRMGGDETTGPDVTNSWNASFLQRGTAFLNREKYDLIDQRIRVVFEKVRTPLVSALAALAAAPPNGHLLSFYAYMGHETCNDLIALFTLVAEYNSFHCAGRERSQLPQSPLGWLAHFDDKLFSLAYILEKLGPVAPYVSGKHYLRDVPAGSILRLTRVGNASSFVFSPVTTTAITALVVGAAVDPALFVVGPAPVPGGAPPPPVPGAGGGAAPPPPVPGAGGGAAPPPPVPGAGGGTPPPPPVPGAGGSGGGPVLPEDVTRILDAIEKQVDDARPVNASAFLIRRKMKNTIQLSRNDRTDEELANLVAGIIRTRIPLLSDPKTFAEVVTTLLSRLQNRAEFLDGFVDAIEPKIKRREPMDAWALTLFEGIVRVMNDPREVTAGRYQLIEEAEAKLSYKNSPSEFEAATVALIEDAKKQKAAAATSPRLPPIPGSPSTVPGTPTSPPPPGAATAPTSPVSPPKTASSDPTSLSSPPTSLPGSSKTTPAKSTLTPAQQLDTLNTELDGIPPYDKVAEKLKSEMMSVITAASLNNVGRLVVTAIDNAMRPRLGFLTYKSFGQLVSELTSLVSNPAEFRPGVANDIRIGIESRDRYDDRTLKLFEKINAILASTDPETRQSVDINTASMLASYGGSLPVDFERAILNEIKNAKVVKDAEVPGSSSLSLPLFPPVDASKYPTTIVNRLENLRTVANMLLDPGLNQLYVDLGKALYDAGIKSLDTAKNPKSADGSYKEDSLVKHVKHVREMMQRVVYAAEYARVRPEIKAALENPEFPAIASIPYPGGGQFGTEAIKVGNGEPILFQTVVDAAGKFVNLADENKLATGNDIVRTLNETEKLPGFSKSISLFPDGPYDQYLLDFVKNVKQQLSTGPETPTKKSGPSGPAVVVSPGGMSPAVYDPEDTDSSQLLANLRKYEKTIRGEDTWKGYFTGKVFQYERFSKNVIWAITRAVISPFVPNIKFAQYSSDTKILVPPAGELFESRADADGKTIANMGGMTAGQYMTVKWEGRAPGSSAPIQAGFLYIPSKDASDGSGVQVARGQLLLFLEAMIDIERIAIARRNGKELNSKMSGVIRNMARPLDEKKSATLYDYFAVQLSLPVGSVRGDDDSSSVPAESSIEESAAMDAEMAALTMYNDTAPVGPAITSELMKKPETVRRLGTANVLFNVAGRLRWFAAAKEGEFGIYATHDKDGETRYNLDTISRNLIRPVIYAYQEALVKLGENQIISSMSSGQGREVAATMTNTDLATVGYPVFDRLVPVGVQYHLGLLIRGMDYTDSPPKERVSIGRGLSDVTSGGWQRYIGDMTFEEKTVFFQEWAKLANLIYLILKDIDVTAADVAFAPVPEEKIEYAPAASPIRYSPAVIAGFMESMFGPVDASVDDWSTWE